MPLASSQRSRASTARQEASTMLCTAGPETSGCSLAWATVSSPIPGGSGLLGTAHVPSLQLVVQVGQKPRVFDAGSDAPLDL